MFKLYFRCLVYFGIYKIMSFTWLHLSETLPFVLVKNIYILFGYSCELAQSCLDDEWKKCQNLRNLVMKKLLFLIK